MSYLPINTAVRLALIYALLILGGCVTPQIAVVEPEPEITGAVAAPQPPPAPLIVIEPCPLTLEDMLIVGDVEHVLVGEEQIMLPARIDTGAKTSSLDITDLAFFERDGERWVQFAVAAPGATEPQLMQRPFERKVRIKRHGEESQPRPVVRLLISMGDLSREVEVSLTNRSGFRYPVLIGRNFLDGHAVVDVSRKFVATDSD